MINRGGEMEVFVRVVEHGSFSATARAMNLTPSAISKLMSRLEHRLGVPLIIRSTRGLKLTVEGEAYFERAQRIVAEIAQSERAVAAAADDVRGTLRVNANIPFTQHHLLPLIPEFLRKYPEVSLDLIQTDLPVDLIYDRTDIAIRTGHLPDSALKARKLMETPRKVVAAPSYLKRFGVPTHPSDLRQYNCLGLNVRRGLDLWPFSGPQQQRHDQNVHGNLTTSDGEMMRQMAIAGVGIARLSDFHIKNDIATGALVPLLEDFNPGDTEPVHALYADHAHLSNRIRAFIDHVVEGVRTSG